MTHPKVSRLVPLSTSPAASTELEELKSALSPLSEAVLPALKRDVVRWLARELAEGLDGKSAEEQVAFFLRKGCVEVAGQLISNLENPNTFVPFSHGLQSGPLLVLAHCSIQKQSLPIIHQLLANGADPNLPDDRGIYPIQYAVWKTWDNDELFPLLDRYIEAGADFTLEGLGIIKSVVDRVRYRKEARELVKINDLRSLIQKLVRCGAPIDDTGKIESDHTALSLAVENDAPSLVALLLDLGANAAYTCDDGGRKAVYPLIRAAEKGMFPTVQKLLRRGANPCAERVTGERGINQALFHVSLEGPEELAVELVQRTEPSYLLQSDFGFMYSGDTPFRFAERRGLVRLAEEIRRRTQSSL